MALMSLDEFAEKCNAMCKLFPEARTEGIHECGDLIESTVKANINALKEPTGVLLSAVTRKDGSGGGYTMVKNNYNIAHHAWLVENGHWTGSKKWTKDSKFVPIYPDGSGLGKLLKRGKWVSGRNMYYNAAQDTRDPCIQIMENAVSKAEEEAFG